MKSLLIRADAGGRLGSGHVMRMIALAQAWIERGGSVTMASAQCPDKLVERLREEGIDYAKLKTSKIGSDQDLVETCELVNELECAWIVLDGYEFGLGYQQGLTETGCKLLVMDDFLYSPEWCADLIVNQNPDCDVDTYVNRNPSGKVLRGVDYVLLRKEFWSTLVKREFPADHTRLLISMGGVDADNLTGKLVESLNDVVGKPLEIRIVLGAGNPHIELLQQLVSHAHQHIEVCYDVRDMPAMYAWADSVITAAGGTVWEWLRYGHYGGFFVVAENQRKLADWLVANKLGKELGSCIGREPPIDKGRIESWFEAASIHQEPHAQDVVDGRGAMRLVERMNQR